MCMCVIYMCVSVCVCIKMKVVCTRALHHPHCATWSPTGPMVHLFRLRLRVQV